MSPEELAIAEQLARGGEQQRLVAVEPSAGGVVRISKVDLAMLDQMVAAVSAEARSEATRRAYAADWSRYVAWCELNGLDSTVVDVVTVKRFLTAEAAEGYAMATIERRAGSLSAIARRAGQPSLYANPEFGDHLIGLRKLAGRNTKDGQRQATALTLERLADVIDHATGDGVIAHRTRALLLAGFGGLLRRSETAALTRGDVIPTSYGFDLRITESKTNKTGRPEFAPLARLGNKTLCPVTAVAAWLEISPMDGDDEPLFPRLTRGGRLGVARDGSRFMDGDSVNAVIQTVTRPTAGSADRFSGHSLRRGGATSRAQRGATVLQLEKAGRWSPGSPEVRKYIAEANRAIEAGAHLLDLPLPTFESEHR